MIKMNKEESIILVFLQISREGCFIVMEEEKGMARKQSFKLTDSDLHRLIELGY